MPGGLFINPGQRNLEALCQLLRGEDVSRLESAWHSCEFGRSSHFLSGLLRPFQEVRLPLQVATPAGEVVVFVLCLDSTIGIYDPVKHDRMAHF
jgi:hypothetical protein